MLDTLAAALKRRTEDDATPLKDDVDAAEVIGLLASQAEGPENKQRRHSVIALAGCLSLGSKKSKEVAVALLGAVSVNNWRTDGWEC